MEEIGAAFVTALKLIITGDPEVLSITLRSIIISGSATILSALIFIPAGSAVFFSEFPGKKGLVNLINTLFSVPTVFVGLVVFIAISRSGPLGGLGLLFTPGAMVTAQALLISPVITGLSISALSGVRPEIKDTALSLGASRVQIAITMLREVRYAMAVVVLAGFGRAISEVGAGIMVGGNIRGYTRTLTTAMSLETSMGNIEFSMALGIILITIALFVSIIVYRLQRL